MGLHRSTAEITEGEGSASLLTPHSHTMKFSTAMVVCLPSSPHMAEKQAMRIRSRVSLLVCVVPVCGVCLCANMSICMWSESDSFPASSGTDTVHRVSPLRPELPVWPA